MIDDRTYDVDRWFSNRKRRRGLNYRIFKDPSILIAGVWVFSIFSVVFTIIALFADQYVHLNLIVRLGLPLNLSMSLWSVFSESPPVGLLQIRGWSHPLREVSMGSGTKSLVRESSLNVSGNSISSGGLSRDVSAPFQLLDLFLRVAHIVPFRYRMF